MRFAAGTLHLLVVPYVILNGLVASEMSKGLSVACFALALALSGGSIGLFLRQRWAFWSLLGIDVVFAAGALGLLVVLHDDSWYVEAIYGGVAACLAGVVFATRRATS